MSAVYSGSNFGVISTANSASGIFTGTSTLPLQYENVQNYTSCSVFVQTSINTILQVNFCNTFNGQITASDSYMVTGATAIGQTINFVPNGQYLQLVLVAQNNMTLSGTYTVQTRYNNTSSGLPDNGYMSGLNSFIGVTGSVLSSFTGAYELVEDYSLITIFASGTLATGQTGPAPGSIDCSFSSDGVNVDRDIVYTIQDVTASDGYSAGSTSSICFNPPHTIVPVSRYFRIKYINGSVPVYPLNISVMFHKNKSKSLTNLVTDNITDYFDADMTRSIVAARTIGSSLPGGNYQNVGIATSTYGGIAGSGYLTTSIKEPVSAFGEILTANLTPISQIDFTQGQPPDTINAGANILYTPPGLTGGYYTFNNSMGTVGITGNTVVGNTGTRVYLQGHQLAKYKPGQGIESKFTAMYPNVLTVGVTGCNVYAGLYNKESSITYGYFYEDGPNGNNVNQLIYNKFAIRHQTQGKQQLNRLTVGGTPGSAAGIILTFGTQSVAIATTSGDTIASVCYNITNAINNTAGLNTWGWNAQYFFTNGSTSIGYVDLLYNYSTSTQIGITPSTTTAISLSIATLRPGQSYTNNYYIQYGATGQNVGLWNIDTCYDQGSLQQNYLYNPSGFKLIPSNGNVYKIAIQYLGFGAITLYVESTNIGLFIPVHQIKWANSNTLTNFSDPSFRPTISVENFTNTVANTVTISTGSMSTFIQGTLTPSPIYRSFGAGTIGITSGSAPTTFNSVLLALTYRELFDSSNSFGATAYYINRTNVFLTSLNFAVTCTTTTNNQNTEGNVSFYLIKNPTSYNIGGTTAVAYPLWQYVQNDALYNFSMTSPTMGYSGGTIITQFSMASGNSLIYDLTPLKIFASGNDTYIIAYYISSLPTSDTIVVSGSISWQVNM